MLALRLARDRRPLVLLPRLVVALAAGGVGFLLLTALAWAAAHPARSGDAGLRLLGCLIPLLAAVQLAVDVARAQAGPRVRSALETAGLGRGGLALLAAAGVTVWCVLGSVLALLAFLHLRGALGGGPLAGAADELLAADRTLPRAAIVTLLCVVPAAVGLATILALRPPAARQRPGGAARTADGAAHGTALPGGLPWGAALVATGLAVETLSAGGSGKSGSGLLPLPGAAEAGAGVLTGWVLTAAGLVLAGPGLTYLCGRLLGAVRPGALRLLAGRVLQEEARRIGRPVGVLCAVGAALLAIARLRAAADDGRVFGPLTLLAAGLVLGCALASLLTALALSRGRRAPVTAALTRLGAPRALLTRAALLRAAALLAGMLALTWLVAELATLPLR